VPDHTTPDSLDELDRRVFDLAVQPTPLAEVAVRLGVSVAQADEKLQRLFARLGVEDRAGLRALAGPAAAAAEPALPPPETEAAAPEYVIGADDQPPLPSPKLGRRRLLQAAGAAVVVAAGGAGALLIRRDSQPSPPASRPTPVAGTIPVGSAAGSEGSFPLTPVDGGAAGFVTRSWRPDELIDWLHGVFFMSVDTGLITGYQFTPARGGSLEWRNYRVMGDGRFLTATNDFDGTSRLLDRDSPARTWTWEAKQYRLLAAFASSTNATVSLLFESTLLEERTFHFVQIAATTAVERVRVPAAATTGLQPLVFQQPGGRRVAVFHGPAERPEVALFDTTSGEQLATYEINPGGQAKDVHIPLAFQHIEGGFLVRWMTPTNGRGEIPQRFYSWPIRWQGDQMLFKREDEPATSYAPNALWAARETGVRWPPSAPRTPGAATWWPSVEISRGNPSEWPQRLRSASITYGDDLPPGRWLKDMSGYLAATRNGYAIVSGGGEPIVTLPAPPSSNPASWFEADWVCGPIPSPFDASLVSFGRVHLYNRVSNRWFAARIPASGGPAHLDPWSAGPREMVFALPHSGHGLAERPVLLAPKFEQPPLDESFRFVVEVDPSGLNLRDEPASQAQSLRLLQDGTPLLLAESSDPSLGPSERSVRQAEGATWLFVRAEDGLEGWANSTWLAWA